MAYPTLAALALILTIAPPGKASGRPLVVDDDGRAAFGNCAAPRPSFASVQAAVDAAHAAQTIFVCPGSYDEQVAVRKNGIKIIGAGVGRTTLHPSAVTTNTVALRTGFPSAAVVLVDGVARVDIEDLTIDGSGASLPSDCPPYFGLYYRNGSGTVRSARVTGIDQCVSVGIFVQSSVDGSGTARVAVRKSAVDHFGTAGMLCNEAGTDCAITNTTIAGLDGSGTNFFGIALGFGARGHVLHDVVRGVQCLLDFCGRPDIAPTSALGIAAFDAPKGTLVAANTVIRNDNGIGLIGGSGCCRTVANRIRDNRFAGIGVQDSTQRVSGNWISGGLWGIFALALERDTLVLAYGNHISGTAIAPTGSFSCCGLTATVVIRP